VRASLIIQKGSAFAMSALDLHPLSVNCDFVSSVNSLPPLRLTIPHLEFVNCVEGQMGIFCSSPEPRP
jgi:hypothetical protein